MPTITPSQLPASNPLDSADIFIVQQGTVVAKTSYSSLRQNILTVLQAYVAQELASEYTDVTQAIAELNTLLSQKASINHTHTKADVGLSLVENISPMNMPISTAMQNALDLKMSAGDFTATELVVTGTIEW